MHTGHQTVMIHWKICSVMNENSRMLTPLNKNEGRSIFGMFSIKYVGMKFCDLNDVVGKVCNFEV